MMHLTIARCHIKSSIPPCLHAYCQSDVADGIISLPLQPSRDAVYDLEDQQFDAFSEAYFPWTIYKSEDIWQTSSYRQHLEPLPRVYKLQVQEHIHASDEQIRNSRISNRKYQTHWNTGATDAIGNRRRKDTQKEISCIIPKCIGTTAGMGQAGTVLLFFYYCKTQFFPRIHVNNGRRVDRLGKIPTKRLCVFPYLLSEDNKNSISIMPHDYLQSPRLLLACACLSTSHSCSERSISSIVSFPQSIKLLWGPAARFILIAASMYGSTFLSTFAHNVCSAIILVLTTTRFKD